MKTVLTFAVSASFMTATPVSQSGDTPCCGEVTPEGRRLAKVLDSMQVESLWLAHEHVDWESGQPDWDADYEGPGKTTHCSAFAAAAGKRLDVYMLRPPEHRQILLARAQAKRFPSIKGQAADWREVSTARKAQRPANQGNLVAVVFDSPNPQKPGHIAIVRPCEKAGRRSFKRANNYESTSTQNGFRAHPGAWPGGVRYYAHPVSQQP